MANDLRRGFMTDEPAPEPQGGLASKAMGGLSKFLGDVNRGIEVVMSHPLYQRAWSGLVSGTTGDPMAGPMALQALQQGALNQEYQRRDLAQMGKPTIQDELNLHRLNAYREQERKQIALQRALSDDDPSNDRAAFMAAYPEKAAESMFSTKAPGKLQLDWEIGSNGMRRRVQVNPDGTTTPLSGAQWVPVQPPMQINLPNQDYNRGGEIRKEWNVEVVKPTQVGTDAIRRIRAGASQGTAAGDMAVIFGFMKLQDPNSSVREGEYATAENAGGIPDRIRVLYNKVRDGEKLSDAQRRDFVTTAEGQFEENYRKPYIQREQFYRGVAGRAGLSPDDVLYDALGDLRNPPKARSDKPIIEGDAARAEGLE